MTPSVNFADSDVHKEEDSCNTNAWIKKNYFLYTYI